MDLCSSMGGRLSGRRARRYNSLVCSAFTETIRRFNPLILLAGCAVALLSPTASVATPPTDVNLQYLGGRIVVNPSYINIFWGAKWTTGIGYTDRQTLDAFVQTVATSAPFSSVLTQYGGAGGVYPHAGQYPQPGSLFYPDVLVPGEAGAVIDDSKFGGAIESWVQAGLVPTPSPDLIYILYLPQGVEVTEYGENSITDFCSYHSTFQAASGDLIRYVIIPYQGLNGGCGDNTEVNRVDVSTLDLSHELAEAITDPDIGLANTFDDGLLGWYDIHNGEVADICEGESDSILFGYRVQPIWSNADHACLSTRGTGDTSPPLIGKVVTGTVGSNNWYTGNVGIAWSLTDPESAISSNTGCGMASISADTAALTLVCSATSEGGTATQSVTIKRDGTKPTVTFAGNAGTYSALQTVSISCLAADATSGVANSTCAPTTGPAYGFTLGTNTITASATDNAGNNVSATTTFVVTASAADLAALTAQFVESSAVYLGASPAQKAVVRGVIAVASGVLAKILPGLDSKQKKTVIGVYEADIAALSRSGWLTANQVQVLDKIAGAL